MYKNLAEMFLETKKNFGDKKAFATRTKGKTFEFITYQELIEKAENLALALIDLGVEAREHVGLIADNRLEYFL